MNFIRHKRAHRKSLRQCVRPAATALALAAIILAASCTPPEASNDAAGSGSAGIGGAGKSAPQKPNVTITQSGPTPPPALETVPPDVWNAEIQAVDGSAFRLSDFKDRTIVLDIWATWCGPCRLEIPHLVELNKEYAGKGVEIIGLTTENPSTDREKVLAFAKEFKINYRLGWATTTVAGPLMQGINSIPQTFVIAPGGKILIKYRGYSPQLPSALRAAIDKARDVKTGD